MNEVFYVANYTQGTANEVSALQAVRDKLLGTGAESGNVFLIDDQNPKSTVQVGPVPATAMDRIVNHLAMLANRPAGPPERINLVGHFGDDGLILHRKGAVVDRLTHDPGTWGALGRISVHSSASSPNLWLSSKHTLRLLCCTLLDTPKCKAACDGPLMATAINRSYCVHVEATRQVFNATHVEEGKLSAAGASILERVSCLTSMAARACCTDSPCAKVWVLVWLPYTRAKRPWLVTKVARVREQLKPLPLPAALASELGARIGWEVGRPSPGLLALPDAVLLAVVGSGAKAEQVELEVVVGGRAVFTPRDQMLYPLEPAYAQALSAWLDGPDAGTSAGGPAGRGRSRRQTLR